MGLRRYKRISFGINAAFEIFQNATYKSLHGVKGTINISDGILVFGKSKSDHDINLKETPREWTIYIYTHVYSVLCDNK